MITSTPRLAVRASSWIIRISMSRIVRNPIVSVIRATPPGTTRRRKAARAASGASAPRWISEDTPLTIWTPCDTPMAKTRKGTRMDMGSIPNPRSLRMPRSQMTAITEQVRARSVSRCERVNT